MARCGCNSNCSCLLEVVDTNTVDLSLKGNGNAGNSYEVKADVIVSPEDGNTLTAIPDGLYVPGVAVDDTNTVDMTVTDNVVTADVILDPTPPQGGTNLIGVGPEGLFVECADVRTCFIGGDALAYDPATGEFDAEISTDANNNISFGTDGGLFSPIPNTADQTTVGDTDTVDMTLTGTNITADVRLDPTPPQGGTNLIGSGADGLFVECADVRTCFSGGDALAYDPATGEFDAEISTDANNNITFGSDGGLFSPAPNTADQTTVGDTDTVDMTLTGTNITADVRLDPAPPQGGTNLIGSGPDGLFVECADVRTCFTEGPGIDYDPATGVIAADVSTTAGNQLSVDANGLFVPPATGESTTVSDTNTVDLTLTGTNITADVIVDPAAGNQLSATPAGLFVPAPDGSETVVNVADTSCVNMTRTGTGTVADPYIISAAPIIAAEPNGLTCGPNGLVVAPSTDAGNSLTIGTDGNLFAPPLAGGDTTTVADTASVDLTMTGSQITADVRLGTPDEGGANLIELEADGLSVSCADVRTCISEGPGIDYDPVTGVISADISTTAGNQLTIDANGLFVPASGGGADTPLAVTDTNSVNLTINPAQPQTLTADVIVGCGLTVTPGVGVTADTATWSYACPESEGTNVYCDPATGQLISEPEKYVVDEYDKVLSSAGTVDSATISAVGAGNVPFGPTINKTITNPSNCRPMELRIYVGVQHVQVSHNNAGNNSVFLGARANITGSVSGSLGPGAGHQAWRTANRVSGDVFAFDAMYTRSEPLVLVLPPGGSINIVAQGDFTNFIDTGTCTINQWETFLEVKGFTA